MQRGAFRLESVNTRLVVRDILSTRIEQLGELGQTCGHGSTLAAQVFLLLALGGHAHTNLVQLLNGNIFPLANYQDIIFGIGTTHASLLDGGCHLGDVHLEVLHVGETGAERFAQLHCLAGKGFAAGLEVGVLTLCQLLFVLDGCAFDLRVLQCVAGGEQAILCIIERLHGRGPSASVDLELLNDSGKRLVEFGDLGLANKRGLPGIFTGSSTADNAFAGDQLASERDDTEIRVLCLDAESGLEVLDHDNVGEQRHGKGMRLALGAHAGGSPRNRTFRQDVALLLTRTNPFARDERGLAELLARQRGESGLGHHGVLEKNRL